MNGHIDNGECGMEYSVTVHIDVTDAVVKSKMESINMNSIVLYAISKSINRAKFFAINDGNLKDVKLCYNSEKSFNNIIICGPNETFESFNAKFNRNNHKEEMNLKGENQHIFTVLLLNNLPFESFAISKQCKNIGESTVFVAGKIYKDTNRCMRLPFTIKTDTKTIRPFEIASLFEEIEKHTNS